MIKVSLLYPNGAGTTFNMDYFVNTHVPMTLQRVGAACKSGAVEQGISGGEPGSAPTYVAMGHMYFETLDDFTSSFYPHADEVMGDIPNYTNITPIIQISEVKI